MRKMRLIIFALYLITVNQATKINLTFSILTFIFFIF